MRSARDRMRAQLFQQMQRFPVLLTPVCAVPAFRHRQREWPINGHSLNMLEIMSPATPWNLLGMPGLVVPMSVTDDGDALGVQLVAKPYDEELLLQVGALLEQARGPFRTAARIPRVRPSVAAHAHTFHRARRDSGAWREPAGDVG